MNGSYMAEESEIQMQAALVKQRQQLMKEREEELALFLEMNRRDKEHNSLLFSNAQGFDSPLAGTSPMFNTRKVGVDDFLNSDNDKNDYEWLLTPPGTPLFPSLEMEPQQTVMSQIGTPKARSTALKSRLANPQPDPVIRGNAVSKQSASSPGLNSSGSAVRRPSSSGGPGSRPATPTGRSTPTSASRPSRSSTPSSQASLASPKPATSTIRPTTSAAKPSSSATRLTASGTKTTVSARSSTPTRPAASSSTPTSTRPAARSSTPTPARPAPRSSTPTPARPALRSSTPARPALRSSTPTPARPAARSSTPTPTARSSVPPSKITSRTATPTRRPSTPLSASSVPASSIKSSPSSIAKASALTTRSPVLSHGASPTVKSRPWNPSEMPGYSLDAPPNLRTTLPDRPLSTARGRPGAPISRSSSIEPLSNGRTRRQSCSPSRVSARNGLIHASGSSVPAISRHSKVNDNVSPVLIGTKMVERVINMRKLAPAKPDYKHSPHSNLSGKSATPDSSGFGRTLSKKSLDMAIRHMDIRRSIPGNLRPLMTNIPASSMYSVRSGRTQTRTVSVTDSSHATSSNASSEVSVSKNGINLDGIELEDEVGSDRVDRAPIQGQ